MEENVFSGNEMDGEHSDYVRGDHAGDPHARAGTGGDGNEGYHFGSNWTVADWCATSS